MKKKKLQRREDERKINVKFQPNESNNIDHAWVRYLPTATLAVK